MIKHRRIRIIITILIMLTATTLITPLLSATGNGYSSYEFLPSPNYTQNDIKAVLKIYSDISGLPTHQVTWKDPQGIAITCPGCTTSYEYSANGYIISSTSEFPIDGQLRPSGTYTAVVTYCTYYVGNTCLGWGEMFSADFYISDGSVHYTISGVVGISGATLNYMDETPKSVTADGSGGYTITVPAGWSGSVTPSLTDYFFLPSSKTYTNVPADLPAQNYTAIAITDRVYLPLVIH